MLTNEERAALIHDDRPGVRDRETITYSELARFRNCPKKFEVRCEHGLASPTKSDALWFGAIWADAQEAFWEVGPHGEDLSSVTNALNDGYDLINQKTPREHSYYERRNNLVLSSMLYHYARRWIANEPKQGEGEVHDSAFEVEAVELEFLAPIRAPETDGYSATFRLGGKLDRLLRRKSDGSLWVGEMKTAATISGDYLSMLWTNFQILIYTRYLSDLLGEPIKGALYDVCAKPRIVLKEGKVETENDFQDRIAKLRTKAEGYKREETKAKHHLVADKAQVDGPLATPGETDGDYSARLGAFFEQEGSFHRTLIEFTDEDLAHCRRDVWDLTQQIIAARRREHFSRNTSQCRAFNRLCEYVPICSRGGVVDDVTRSLYEEKARHPELEGSVKGEPATVGDDGIPF